MTDYLLPSELWMKAFLYVDSMKDLQQCALVCTKWKQMAESHIFSRNIMVKGSLQTRTLQTYLIHHIEKRCTLKHITLGRRDHFTLDMKYLMPVVITPSLETLEGNILDDQFFIILLEIIENGPTELKLKIIPSALTYSNTYDTILYQLKDSLEEVQLNFKKYTANTWTTLYNLEQITHLRSLNILSNIHTILQIDRILTKCNHLEMLTIHLSLVSGTGRDRDFAAWVAQDVGRNSGLTTLTVRFGKVYDIRLMDYLTHKYPNLETIVVERMPQDVWKSYNTAELVLDMDEIPALLKKMETVPTYALQCIISEIEAAQLLPMLKLCGYNACFGCQKAVNSFTTKELRVSSGHAIIASEICRAVKIPPTLYMA